MVFLYIELPLHPSPTLVYLYNDSLMCLLDKHAPMKTKTFVQRATVPWYNQAIQATKRDRRRMEQLWNVTGLMNITMTK